MYILCHKPTYLTCCYWNSTTKITFSWQPYSLLILGLQRGEEGCPKGPSLTYTGGGRSLHFHSPRDKYQWQDCNFFYKISNMAATKVLRSKDWFVFIACMSRFCSRAAIFYTSFVVCHTTIKSHKVINEFVQYLFMYT